jgi:ferritin-like metal-binding protein YciE
MATTVKPKKAAPEAAPLKKKVLQPAPAEEPKSSKTEPALMEFFIDGVKDIYWAEKHLTKVLPKMKKAATSTDLAGAIEGHLEVTKTQVERLDKVFELLDKKARAKKCEAMAGITDEGESMVKETEKGTATRDVAIIMASQKIEHYEIATYGGLAQLAETLGLNEVKELLGQSLSEEKQADEMLTDIAKSKINYQAAEEEA